MSQTPTSPPPLTADQIRRHLLRADEVARRAMSLGRHPFGAVVVKLFVAKIDQLKGVFWALVRAPVCLG